MKKIKNLRQLKREKERIKQHQEDLEDAIHDNWHELKDDLKPANIAKQVIGNWIRKRTEAKMNAGGILKSTVTYGAAMLATKLFGRTGNKLAGLLKK